MALLLHLASDKGEGVDFYCIFADVRKNTVKIDSLPLSAFVSIWPYSPPRLLPCRRPLFMYLRHCQTWRDLCVMMVCCALLCCVRCDA